MKIFHSDVDESKLETISDLWKVTLLFLMCTFDRKKFVFSFISLICCYCDNYLGDNSSTAALV